MGKIYISVLHKYYMIEISKIQKPENKDVIITVRTTKENKEWMDKNNISPSLFFDEAIVELRNKMKNTVHRKDCVICGKSTKQVKISNGLETFSFCSMKCMDTYLAKNKDGKGLEVCGTRIYVK